MVSRGLDCTIKFRRISTGSKLPLAERSVCELISDKCHIANKTYARRTYDGSWIKRNTILKYGTDIEIVIEVSKLLRATIVTARR